MRRAAIACVLMTLLISACARKGTIHDYMVQPPSTGLYTKTALDLADLPSVKQQISVSVFEFGDLTGAHKPSDKFAEFSKAVTQGGLPILIDSLKTACSGSCFRVVERAGLKNLLQERQIIQSTRAQHNQNQQLTPLTFAGVILEGGIVGYDTNTLTGGGGARYLGVGGDAKYRQDVVTVSMRLVSVNTGEVLQSITTSKTIYSIAVQGSAFKYVALDSLLEVEAGMTRNEPPQLAVREAIELGVYSVLMEGALKGLWQFNNPEKGKKAIDLYRYRKNRPLEANEVANVIGQN